MSKLADIREQIKVMLQGAPGIGIVPEYERLATDYNKMLALFKDADGRINGWTITRDETPERWITNVDYERVFEMVIRGYMGLQDAEATEIIFQDLVENISSAFRVSDTLSGTCETINPEFGKMAGRSGIQVIIVEPRLFGSVLCHHCELRLGAQIKGQR